MNNLTYESTGDDTKKSKDVFVSILTDSGPTKSPSTSSGSHALQAFQSRVHEKRVTLANLDRSRPVPSSDSLAAKQIQKRNVRLIKKSKRTDNREDAKRQIAQEIEKQLGQSNKSLSRRQRKRFGLGEIDDNITFNSLLQVHQLWLGYVQRLLGLIDANGKVSRSILPTQLHSLKGKGKDEEGSNAPIISSGNQLSLQSVIVKADFVGAPIRVVRALNPSLVGIQGLVAKESESTFQIVVDPDSIKHPTKMQSIKIIPKQNTVFVIQVTIPQDEQTLARHPFSNDLANFEFTLYGNQLRNTLPTRATKKFKSRKTIELG